MINENLKLKGRLQITMHRGSGEIENYDFKNLVVDAGKTFVAARMVGAASAVMSHMAVGTLNTPPAVSNTSLGVEVARQSFDNSGSAGPVVTYSATFGPGVGTGALVEAGIFNASTVGTMLSRVVYPVVNKGASDTMSVTWTITVT